MRKTILAMAGLLVFGWAVSQGQTSTETATQMQQGTTEQVQLEEYVPRVIIEGKWGTGPGEFGVAEGYQILPKKITVDNKENIFILDTANSRIQKFDKNGKHLFSIPIKSFQKNWYYDKNGPIAGSIEKYSTDVWTDDENQLYVLNIPKDDKRDIEIYENGKTFKTRMTINKKEVESYKKVKKNNIMGFLKSDLIEKNKQIIFLIDKNKVEKELVITTEKNLDSVKYLGTDIWNNIYVRCNTWGGQYIYKYSFSLKLIAKIKSYEGTKDTFFESDMEIDSKGNIYQLVTEYPTVRVIKWEKKK
ncbi:MAG TPA: hypothetical protein DCX95_01420 [Elusimicrobia bacterium]|nr:hypothetical protein [Elusimicrobiota bacterium]